MEDKPIKQKQKRGRKPIHTAESRRIAWNDYQREYYARKTDKYVQFKDIRLTDIKTILSENEKNQHELNKVKNENKKIGNELIKVKNENTDLNEVITQSKTIIKDLITENNKLKVIAVKQKQLLNKNK